MQKTILNKHKLMAGLALAATGAGATSALAANERVCFDAEEAVTIRPTLKKVVAGAKKDYSGKGYIEIPWDRNESKGTGDATFKVNVKTAGTYYLWARTFWLNGCGNSIGVSVNGSERILGEDGTYERWHWVSSPTRVSLKAGQNVIVLKNRETGVRVDQFFLCQDGEYTPTGVRKITHNLKNNVLVAAR